MLKSENIIKVHWKNITFIHTRLMFYDFFYLQNIKTVKYNYLYNYLYLRFEVFWKPSEKKWWFFVFRPILKFFKPYVFTFNNLSNSFIFFKFQSGTYQGYRHFLLLPVNGNRTWSNRKNQRRVSLKFFYFYVSFFFKKYGSYCKLSRQKALVYAEIINKLYFTKFPSLWIAARKHFNSYRSAKTYRPWKFDLQAILANKVHTHIIKPERINKQKKRRNVKKIKLNPNIVNLGFSFLFTRYTQDRIYKYSKNLVRYSNQKTKKKGKKK